MAALEIRPSAPGDVEAIARGFARECGKPVRALSDKIRWALFENPAGSSGVVAVRGPAQMVAHLGASHVPMIVDGRAASFARLYAPWIAPEFRVAGVHGLFGQLDERLQELLVAASVEATFGVFVEEDWWTTRRLRGFEPVRTELSLVREPGPHRPAGPGLEVVPLTAESAGALEGGLALGGCHAVRDARSVRFRCGGPHGGDVASIALRGRRAAGILIVRGTPRRRVVMDLVAPEGDEEAAAALFDRAIGDGAGEVVLPWFSRSPWLLFAQRMGFRVAGGDLPFLGARAATSRLQASWLMRYWHVSAADVGLRPPPRMLAAEETVTTAPMGTLAAKDRKA